MRYAWSLHWLDYGFADEVTIYTVSYSERVRLLDEGSVYTFVHSGKKYPYDRGVIENVFKAMRDTSTIMLYGPPGTGKTTMASLICKWLTMLNTEVPEPDLIPDKWGINKFADLEQNRCIVIDDLVLLGTNRRTEESFKGFALVADVQTQMLKFLEWARDMNVFVFVTTNMLPEMMEPALLSRLKSVEIPPPSEAVKQKLREYGYKIANERGRSFRELLWGTTGAVVEIPPVQTRVISDDLWVFQLVKVYRVRYSTYLFPTPLLVKAAALLSYNLQRPAVFLKNPIAVEQLYFYKRPIVVLPGGMTQLDMERLALKFNATILTEGGDEKVETVSLSLEMAKLVCPTITQGDFGFYECYRKAAEEILG
ncbi:MAG: ATP-binding protein [Pyrobaculum sp.]